MTDFLLSAALLIFALLIPTVAASRPLALHPENPHYFLFRDKPTVLIGSGEHYGAVLNLDFDYARYLETLAADGLNHTRTFNGVYCEPVGAFKISGNTLAPAAGRFSAPWARSDTPGYANGGALFDLSKWDAGYFERLKDFVGKASERGIVVELVLFCPFYNEGMWNLSPMNPANNVNGIGSESGTDAYTTDRQSGLLDVQEALTKKVVAELNEFDNVYYEVCNEPYAKDVPMDWQACIIRAIVDTQADLPDQHLISLNISNGAQKVDDPSPEVSVFNFHYASPPDAVAMNADLNCAIGDNETGFRKTGDTVYRREAWEFILAGGALFSHLDYSFAVGHEDGRYPYPSTQPGGGNAGFRRQMRVLKDLIHGLEFLRMGPDTGVVRSSTPAVATRCLSEPGRQYAVYVFGADQVELTLALPQGRYVAQWVNTLTGAVDREEALTHPGGDCVLESPPFVEDVALRIVLEDGA